MESKSPGKNRYRDAAAQFKRDGYFIARQIVPREQVNGVFSDMHGLVAQQLRHFGLPVRADSSAESVHADLRALLTHDRKAYLATLTLCAKLVSLYELHLHPNVRAFVQSIGIALPVFQTAPVMHLMSHALKIPGGYQGFGVHQDWPTLQGGLDTVTLWIPFVDVDRNLFTMDLIPGSHMGGLYPYTRSDHIFEVNPEHYREEDFVPMEAQRGDIVFMSSFTIHRSSLRGDDRLRISTSMRYENAAELHYITRQYPFAQKRSVIPDLITPDFPSVEQVRAVYNAPAP